MRRLLGAAAGILALAAPAAASAATISVNVASDSVVADGGCSLREAIAAANADAPVFLGGGECAAGSGVDSIQLPAATLTLSLANAPGALDENANAKGDLDVLSNLTIAGAGTTVTTLDAAGIDRALDVATNHVVTVQGLTIRNGHAPDGAGNAFAEGGNASSGDAGYAIGGSGELGASGGAIRNAGNLTLVDAILAGNAAGDGGAGGYAIGGHAGTDPTTGGHGGDATGGDGGDGGAGGAIASTGSLTLTRVTVTGNHAGSGGVGGAATAGYGGDGQNGNGGAGGGAVGGSGGRGGTGGAIAATGPVSIDQSTIATNVAGKGGKGGDAVAGHGGTSGASRGTGGAGGAGTGGAGGTGGGGGAIWSTDQAAISHSLLDGNAGGSGGSGGDGTGANGGNTNSGTGGSGGFGSGGGGGPGGQAGGVHASVVVLAGSTVASNHSGGGGAGGTGSGGNGGSVFTGGSGSAGYGAGGNGGGGARTGGVMGTTSASLTHVTVASNALGAGGTGGGATGGSPGGSAFGGLSGAASSTGSAVDSPGTTTIASSILSGNGAGGCVGTITNGGHDIARDSTGCPGDDVDPLLGPLADNGGPSKTLRPAAGSPAIDAVPVLTEGCSGATDQRGVPRPSGAGCDIGAYEHAAPSAQTGTATPTAVAADLHAQINPNAQATDFAFEFGTTTAYGTSSAAQKLPGGLDATAVAASIAGLAPSTTYHFRVVATNPDGTTRGEDATFTTGAQAARDTTAPVILSASVKPKSFRRRRGTTFRYRLSEATRVTFTIQRKKGRRYVKATRFSKASKAGANTRRFKTRKLRPGRYRATLVATDPAGNRSKPKRLTFRARR